MLAFRPASAGEAPRLADFVNAAYRGEGAKRGWTTEAGILGGQRTDAGALREVIEAAGSRLELAFEGEALVGCVQLVREPSGACYLGMLTVAPDRQAGGIGKALLGRSEELAREWGCRGMRMTVIEVRKELISYYERRGYERTGATEPFPEDDRRFGLPKVRGLRFVELTKTI